MAHYALLNENNIVIQVLYVDNIHICDKDGNECEELGIAQCREGLNDPNAKLIKTSINANIGVRYASIGDYYSEEYDAFISPKPYESWVLNTTTLNYEPPVPLPLDEPENGFYVWDEDSKNWKVEEFPQQTQVITDAFRTELNLTEKLLWDNPDTASTPSQKAVLTTFKKELPLTVGEQQTEELLNLLVSEGIYTQERLDEIISNF